MAEPAKDQNKSKTDGKKKETATIILTTEELRAISGGAGVNNPNPVNPNPNSTNQ